MIPVGIPTGPCPVRNGPRLTSNQRDPSGALDPAGSWTVIDPCSSTPRLGASPGTPTPTQYPPSSRTVPSATNGAETASKTPAETGGDAARVDSRGVNPPAGL